MWETKKTCLCTFLQSFATIAVLIIFWISRIYYFISQCSARDSIIIPTSAKKNCALCAIKSSAKRTWQSYAIVEEMFVLEKVWFDSICTKCTKQPTSEDCALCGHSFCTKCSWRNFAENQLNKSFRPDETNVMRKTTVFGICMSIYI